jgi:hypothetical protein
MATSLDKLHAHLRAFEEGPPSSDPVELTLRTVLQFVGPQLAQLLPDDPAELDQLCAHGAAMLLRLRSDDAPELGVYTTQPLELEQPDVELVRETPGE